MNPNVDAFIENNKHWQAELAALREVVLECGLIEEYKWKQPCYTFGQKNIGILSSFKAFTFFSFFKGVLLKDEKLLLIKPGDNSQSVKYLTFSSLEDIQAKRDLLKAYLFEAIDIEKSGQKVELSKSKDFELPAELLEKFEEMPELKTAFEALTLGRQRGYYLHFTGAKQSKSRMARIEKSTQRILDGYGFHDCVCGHSKRMPTCDGSHKYLPITDAPI